MADSVALKLKAELPRLSLIQERHIQRAVVPAANHADRVRPVRAAPRQMGILTTPGALALERSETQAAAADLPRGIAQRVWMEADKPGAWLLGREVTAEMAVPVLPMEPLAKLLAAVAAAAEKMVTAVTAQTD